MQIMSKSNYFSTHHLVVVVVFICSVYVSKVLASPQDGIVPGAPAGNSYTVCAGVAVPANYALVGIEVDYGCGKQWTAYTVAPAQPGMRACNLSETIGGSTQAMPFPADFYVQNIEYVDYTQSKCGGTTAVYIIQPATEGATACSGSHLPAGWSFTSSMPSNGSCDTTLRNEIHQAVDGMRICMQSPYPEGFAIGAVERIAACDTAERYVLRMAEDGMKACGPTHVPTGYVITSTDQSGQCADYQTLTLRMAYDGVVVCPSSPIPDRYVIEATVPYGGCQNYATANRLKHIP